MFFLVVESVMPKLWSNIAILLANKAVSIALLLLLAWFAKKISKRVVTALLSKWSSKSALKEQHVQLATLRSLFLNLVHYAIYFVVFFSICTVLGVGSSAMVALAGVGSVAIGLGSQSLAKDIITGTTILIENAFSVGDNVAIDGKYLGIVEEFGIRVTRIRAENGDLYIIPNSQISVITKINSKKDEKKV